MNGTYDGFRLPNAFKLYMDRSWGKIKLHIGQSRSQPIYYISVPGGWYGNLIMHNGPTVDAPPLASAISHGKTSNRTTMTLPPLGLKQASVQVAFEMESWHKDVYTFHAPVGRGQARAVYQFEWKRSSRDEVKDLGESGSGWKLVRSDGTDEILAVWADASFSRTKAAAFKFLNSAANGALGDAWSILATLTFIKLWQKMMARKVTVAVNA